MQFRDFHILVILLFAAFFSFQTQAQVVTGKIIDEYNEPVPYATIFVAETKEGTISNSEGNYQIQLLNGVYHFTIRSLGYLQAIKEVNVNSDSINLEITLQKQAFEIKEVKIFPGKEDPAMFIMRKAIANAPYYRTKIKYYEADMYIKSNFAFTSIPKIYQNKIEVEGRKLKELIKENVTYVIESQNKITYTYPNKYEQKVISKKTSLVGIDEPPVMELMSASFYDERPNQLISPLSSLALRHYNFRYEGFITVGDFDVFKIRVTPNRKSDELVDGYIYIVDKLWCMYYLDFKGRFEFFDYRIKQQFENLGNNNWLPVSDNIDGSISMLGLKGQVYYGVALKYNVVEENNFGVNLPQDSNIPVATATREQSAKEKKLRAETAAILSKEEPTNRDVAKASRLNRKILKEQYKDTILNDVFRTNYNVEEIKDTLTNDYEFWDTMRAIPLTPAEMQSYAMNDSLMRMKLYDKDSLLEVKPVKEKKMFSKMLFGDWDLAKKDSILRLGYDGLFSFKNFDFNSVDGYKYRQKFELNFKLDPGQQLKIIPEIGYAFNRKAVFASVNSTFKDIFWKNGTVMLGFGKESRDFKTSPPGINPLLNAGSSWLFAENYMKLYETTFFKLNVSQQVKEKLTLSAILDYNQFAPLKNNVEYLFTENRDFSPNLPPGYTTDSPEIMAQKSLMYTVGASYYKRQRKPWLQESPFIFIKDFYTFNLQFKQGVQNIFSSVSNFSQIDFSYHQQANISPSAGIDVYANAGHFFNTGQMHFSQFKHFNTNEIPVMLNFFTHTFQLMNDYEPSTNQSYLNLGSEIRTEYILLRYLSFINTNTWSESLHLNYLTTPALNSYWEAGYSLNSLLFVGNLGVFTGFKGSKFESVMFKITFSGY